MIELETIPCHSVTIKIPHGVPWKPFDNFIHKHTVRGTTMFANREGVVIWGVLGTRRNVELERMVEKANTKAKQSQETTT